MPLDSRGSLGKGRGSLGGLKLDTQLDHSFRSGNSPTGSVGSGSGIGLTSFDGVGGILLPPPVPEGPPREKEPPRSSRTKRGVSFSLGPQAGPGSDCGRCGRCSTCVCTGKSSPEASAHFTDSVSPQGTDRTKADDSADAGAGPSLQQ
mmetsp:Transcript_11605/g.26604  ORF Transcript_11605/g.26604 Transcript_11605/m.26604 type:complete len:148 (-) Transcript_11605:79-522(-)